MARRVAAAAAALALSAGRAALIGQGIGGEEEGSGSAARRPRYELVDGKIETLWQRPLTDSIKAVLFVAHGCKHQATDFFTDRGHDGFELRGCATSELGRCLGLPEERQLVHAARRRGYLVVAVSGTGWNRCWDADEDVPRVESALRHVLSVEGLNPELPVIATGASSGGGFMGPLAQGSLRERLLCVAPQISDARLIAGPSRPPATIFVHMPRDERTASRVSLRLQELRDHGARAAELRVAPSPVNATLLGKALAPEEAAGVVTALREAGYLDEKGRLLEDPRGSDWREALGAAAPPGDSLVADESALAELLNLAWARHELVGGLTDEILDFCEGGAR